MGQLEMEKQALAAEKERETAKLRAMQEKAQDKAAEMDALRAKRAMEAAERAAREKERMERERQESINKELAEARKQQSGPRARRSEWSASVRNPSTKNSQRRGSS